MRKYLILFMLLCYITYPQVVQKKYTKNINEDTIINKFIISEVIKYPKTTQKKYTKIVNNDTIIINNKVILSEISKLDTIIYLLEEKIKSEEKNNNPK